MGGLEGDGAKKWVPGTEGERWVLPFIIRRTRRNKGKRVENEKERERKGERKKVD